MSRISDLPIISLDLETGGLIPGKHTPLAIGAVVLPSVGNIASSGTTYEITKKNSFYVQLEWDTVVVTPQAMKINRLDIANPPGPDGNIEERSLPALDGLNLFCEWLAPHCTPSIHALGVNVGSFDLQMLRSVWDYGLVRKWPFHYRSIDLNSLFFALSQVQNKPFNVVKEEITQTAWHRTWFADEMVHNALADAWSNIYVWEECLRRFNGDCEIQN